ncbi:tumor necrosis factor receptor superfamily member 14-like isoform X4 [Scyliorhinus canicula]|uniref:tumor necrosis factor receptor superfamily member 14-like isoform X4 n=1 Tax=Scyliorhinus canicula TaxID=7830 RepID=UPI0018F44BF9|nr:tumor necrosis factor receptor superfamily member 14-like isoform X4 [Scyliorhinus canicula]
MKRIIFILVLVLNQQVVMPCGPFEYVHNGGCCSVCSPGTIVYSHCQGNVGTKCKPCTDGKYMEHPNGLEKCRKCKACDQELGLRVKHVCIYTRNTICGPRKGYYCIDKSCRMGRKHKTCPLGAGVKEKGTHFKDTVCEVCPEGTYSNIDSSTEACVKWTDCKEHKQNQLNPGTSSTDAVCQAQTNPVVIPVAVVGGGGGRSCSFCSGGDCLSLEEKEGTSR